MGNRRPECILRGLKKSCLKNEGCQFFPDLFEGSQILTMVFFQNSNFRAKIPYRGQFRKTDSYKNKAAKQKNYPSIYPISKKGN